MNDIEAATLALAVQVPDLNPIIISQLEAGYFQEPKHKIIFNALKAVKKADYTLLLDELKQTNRLREAGDTAYITSLKFMPVESANCNEYLKKLIDNTRHRNYLATLRQLTKNAETYQGEIDDMFAEHEAVLLKHTRQTSGFTESTQQQRISGAFDYVNQAYERGGDLIGIDTGLKELNDLTGGWIPGTFNIILAVPGAGKTALWLQSALNVARSSSNVAMVQLEMTDIQIGLRQLSSTSHVGIDRLQRGLLKDGDFQRLADAASRLTSMKYDIYTLDGRFSSWRDIERWYRQKHTDDNCQTLWIDNLKLVEGVGREEKERFQFISRQCKLLAKELNISVIAIHHVTKVIVGKPVTVNDAYGSSAFRQDADFVLVMNEDSTDKDGIWLEAGKARNGKTGLKRKVYFNGSLQRFESSLPTAATDMIYERENF